MYKYTHFIPENIAPAEARRIGVYDGNGQRITGISLGTLAQPNTAPLYRFCVLADVHMDTDSSDEKAEAFAKALNYVNDSEDCKFTCICGDLVDNGAAQAQADNYAAVVSQHAQKPVYAISGNHDTIWGYPTDERMESYAGCPVYFLISHAENPDVPDGDSFIFLGHYGKDHSSGNGDWRGGEQFSSGELVWFESILAANADKRCFVFIHPYIPAGAGNPPLTVTPPNPPPDIWTKKASVSTDAGAEFLNILKKYPGVILFNGHSHYRFRTQEVETKAIIHKPDDGSYVSVHVPSATRLRDVVDGQRVDYTGVGEGYIVDVHEDHIVLNGMDFVAGTCVPLGVYRIHT